MICLEIFEREAKTTEHLASSKKKKKFKAWMQAGIISSSPPYWGHNDFWLSVLSLGKRNTSAFLGLDPFPVQSRRDLLRCLNWCNRLNDSWKVKFQLFSPPWKALLVHMLSSLYGVQRINTVNSGYWRTKGKPQWDGMGPPDQKLYSTVNICIAYIYTLSVQLYAIHAISKLVENSDTY